MRLGGPILAGGEDPERWAAAVRGSGYSAAYCPDVTEDSGAEAEPFAAHLDPVNLINSPSRYFANGELIRDCFAKLGPYIKSCHAKDIVLSDHLTVHLDEARPGLGRLDYAVYLREMSKLDPDTPLMLEHLSTREEYAQAAQHIRGVAERTGVSLC